jgi:hypothetical protein
MAIHQHTLDKAEAGGNSTIEETFLPNGERLNWLALPLHTGYNWGMDIILAVEYGASYAKPPAIFYLVATVSTILYCLYLRRQFAMRRKREQESKRPPDAP